MSLPTHPLIYAISVKERPIYGGFIHAPRFSLSNLTSAISPYDAENVKDPGNAVYPFKAILLASSMDAELQGFFKQYSNEVNNLTGGTCLMFILQKETDDPFALARELGVPVSKFPCLVVFEELQNEIKDLASHPSQ